MGNLSVSFASHFEILEFCHAQATSRSNIFFFLHAQRRREEWTVIAGEDPADQPGRATLSRNRKHKCSLMFHPLSLLDFEPVVQISIEIISMLIRVQATHARSHSPTRTISRIPRTNPKPPKHKNQYHKKNELTERRPCTCGGLL